MKIALVDDEKAELDQLSKMLDRELSARGDVAHRIDCFSSGEEFLRHWQTDSYDLIILDIFMDQLSGIDLAHRIREKNEEVYLVFCTSSNEFACESYEVGAKYYLHKPYGEEGIRRMLKRLDLEDLELSRCIRLPDGQSVLLRKILFTQHAGHVAQLHLKDGSVLRVRLSHEELERLLCEQSCFCCCSKGVIVNFHEVKKQGPDTFELSDGSAVPISRRRAKAVQESYARFRFASMRREVRL